MKYYHLQVLAQGELDEETHIVNSTSHPIVVGNVGIQLHDWLSDDMGTTFPIYFATERLKHVLDYMFSNHKCKFTEIKRVTKSLNFIDNYPDAKLNRLWQVEFNGVPLKDDFALWNNLQLVVSEKALAFLRENLVLKAESILIKDDIDTYFGQFFAPYKINK